MIAYLLPFELLATLSALVFIAFVVYTALFFATRIRLIKYMRKNFSTEDLERLSLLPKNPSRYAKWGLIYKHAQIYDEPLFKRLKRFKRFQLGSGDCFVVLVALQIFTLWFFN